MTPAPSPHQDCIWLLRRGMSVLCIDSYDPPRKNCDHCVSPQCFAPHITTQSERDKVLDSLCKIDFYWYAWGELESEDIELCRGISCNYCGRYNAAQSEAPR